jgi:glycosyltransferase involved in cell wall biosynthesis
VDSARGERDRCSKARDLGIADRVRFLGFQANPWRFMSRADVFVLTSAYEGFGNVLIEAMACGVPVVATRSPGTIEIIEHEVNGLLVEHDAASVAARAAVLDDPGREGGWWPRGAHVVRTPRRRWPGA